MTSLPPPFGPVTTEPTTDRTYLLEPSLQAELEITFVHACKAHGFGAGIAAVARAALSDARRDPGGTDVAVRAVCDVFHIPPKDLFYGGRARVFSAARHVTMFVLRASGKSLPEIARVLKLRNHTTVLHGLRRVKNDESLHRVASGIAQSLGYKTDAETA